MHEVKIIAEFTTGITQDDPVKAEAQASKILLKLLAQGGVADEGPDGIFQVRIVSTSSESLRPSTEDAFNIATGILSTPEMGPPLDKRARLTAMAKGNVPLTVEWEAAVVALEAGDVKPIMKLPTIERQFLEEEIPGVLDKREKLAPTQR